MSQIFFILLLAQVCWGSVGGGLWDARAPPRGRFGMVDRYQGYGPHPADAWVERDPLAGTQAHINRQMATGAPEEFEGKDTVRASRGAESKPAVADPDTDGRDRSGRVGAEEGEEVVADRGADQKPIVRISVFQPGEKYCEKTLERILSQLFKECGGSPEVFVRKLQEKAYRVMFDPKAVNGGAFKPPQYRFKPHKDY